MGSSPPDRGCANPSRLMPAASLVWEGVPPFLVEVTTQLGPSMLNLAAAMSSLEGSLRGFTEAPSGNRVELTKRVCKA